MNTNKNATMLIEFLLRAIIQLSSLCNRLQNMPHTGRSSAMIQRQNTLLYPPGSVRRYGTLQQTNSSARLPIVCYTPFALNTSVVLCGLW
jgi:hypothetical protein